MRVELYDNVIGDFISKQYKMLPKEKKELKMIEFEIPGKITGKSRPRFFRGHAYTPKQTKDYEDWVKLCYLNKYCGQLEGALSVELQVYYEIPKSATKKERKLIEDGLKLPTKKPDVDNIAKIILDGLNGVAWKDDTQVVDLKVNKKFTEEKERIVVTIGKE